MGGCIMEVAVGVPRQPHVALGLVRREVVEDLAVWTVGHPLVHEVEAFDASSSFVVAAGHLAGGDLQGGEQRGRPMPLVVVRLTDHRAAGSRSRRAAAG